MTLLNSVVTANRSARSGGGIANEGSLVLSHTTVTVNTSGGPGGGVYSNTGLTVSDSTVSNNTSGYLGGGGLWLEASMTMTMTNSTVTGKQTTDPRGTGGGVAATGGTISRSVVLNNTAGGAGGGIFNTVDALTVSDSTVSNNTVLGSNGNGGGLAGNILAPLIISRSTISGNSAPYGGGVSPVEGPVTITASTFTGNTGSVAGGDAYIFGGAGTAMTISNSTFVGNSAEQGGFATQNGKVAVTGSIFDRSVCSTGTVIDNGYNLDTSHSCVSPVSPATGSLFDTPSGLAAALANNGGPTQTVALLSATHPAAKKPELLATRPNEVYSGDITKLLGPAKWTYFYLYVIIDIYSRYVPGWMLARAERAHLAERLLADTITKQDVTRDQLTVHSDRGSSMASKPVAFLLADLGVTKSHSRPHVSNDNPFSESHFKTLKYRPEFPERFGSFEDAHAHCSRFFAWYNDEHRHSGIAFHTPADVHHGRAEAIQAHRATVLDAAYAAHPERFVRKPPTPLELPNAAWINKPHDNEPDSMNL